MRVQLICDDEEATRAIRLLLSKMSEELEVAGVSDTSRDGIVRVRKSRPDIVIFDVDGQVEGRLDTIRTLSQPLPAIQVLVRGTGMDREMIERVLRAGALGVFGSGHEDGQLLEALRKIRAGQSNSSATARLQETSDVRLDALSPRERQVLVGLADGKSSKEVAHDLRISSKTVDTHRRNLMRKLGVSGIADLVKYAIRVGLTTLEPTRTDSDPAGPQ